MSNIVFDLTEVFSASTGKLRYYGIMRVVHEIALELVRRNADVRFAIFSYAHKGFLEVTPTRADDGTVNLQVPQGIRERRIRPPYRRKSTISRAFAGLTNPLAQHLNRRAWRRANLSLPRIDLSGKTLVSAVRPKLIADALHMLDQRGETVDLVALLYDLIPLHPQFGHKSAYLPGKFLDDNTIIIERARALLAISEFTKSEILAFSKQGLLPPAPPVTTIPLVHECALGARAPTITLPEAPYLLTVGATMGRKNLEASFEALLDLQRAGVEPPVLVIAGAARKTTQTYLETAKMAPIRDKVVVCSSPSQEDLVALYKGALALVMASRMEGWGLPAGEALWCGTPAICSTAPVLREVCGELGLYFDPDASDQLAAHIRRLMEDDVYRADLRDRIAAGRQKLRTWGHVTSDLQAALAQP